MTRPCYTVLRLLLSLLVEIYTILQHPGSPRIYNTCLNTTDASKRVLFEWPTPLPPPLKPLPLVSPAPARRFPSRQFAYRKSAPAATSIGAAAFRRPLPRPGWGLSRLLFWVLWLCLFLGALPPPQALAQEGAGGMAWHGCVLLRMKSGMLMLLDGPEYRDSSGVA